MNIEAKITAHESGAQKGFGEVNVGGMFIIEGIKVMEGPKGLFVALPSYKKGDGTFKDIVYPITKEARETLNEVVLESYKQSLEVKKNKLIEPQESSKEKANERKERKDDIPKKKEAAPEVQAPKRQAKSR